MLHATGGQIIAVSFTCAFTVFGVIFYYFIERRHNKSIKKNKMITLKTRRSQNSIRKFSERYILNTRKAAHLLNISRPHLIDLLEEGRLPYRKIGTSRQIKLKDIIQFKQETVPNWTKVQELEFYFSYIYQEHLL